MARKPQQQRSRATVEAIVEAGFICLARGGYEGTTTRHIADVAGISVGTLYEYFTNKQDIYEAMYKRAVEDVVSMIEPLTARLVRMDIREGVKLLLAEFRELLMRHDGRYLKFASHAVQAAPHLDLQPVQKILGEVVLQYLMHQPQLMRMQNIPVMSYIVINGGMFAMIRHLGESSPIMTFEQLSDGLADMVDHVVTGELRKADRNNPQDTGASG
ncbi:MAG: TetR/AcrR family transcriptional regulator [Alcanivoracaceae bacterium]|nr:TetR/AcrR family transcriptional regulator [Alcanivoracaceae bacterium]